MRSHISVVATMAASVQRSNSGPSVTYSDSRSRRASAVASAQAAMPSKTSMVVRFRRAVSDSVVMLHHLLQGPLRPEV